MTNTQSLGTIEATNPVLAVAPLKEETEMLRATDKITALYCRLSVEDLKEDKKGGKEDESNSIQNQKMILLQYAKEHRFPNPTFSWTMDIAVRTLTVPAFKLCLRKSKRAEWQSAVRKTYHDWGVIPR